MKNRIILFIILIHFINCVTINLSDKDFENIFGKDSSVKTTKNYVFFKSSSFKVGKSMEFTLTSKYHCENEIKYNFYDSSEVVLSVPYTVKTSNIDYTNKKGKTKIVFSIKKEKEELNNLEGDYLLIYFQCSGEITIKNGKNKKAITAAVVIILIAVLIIVGALLFYYLYYKKKKEQNLPIFQFFKSWVK